MAAKKQVKKAGTALATWNEELARRAEIATKTAESTGGTSKSISTRGGVFTIDGGVVPGGVLNVVVLDSILETAYYGTKFDPDNITAPVAFALGRDDKELTWHENSDAEYAGKLCKDSDINQWGSADTGRGKAAKNLRRLMVITENDLEDIPAAEHRMLKVPVTSGKAWDGYVKQVKEVHKRPPLGVLTEIKILPDPKTQFKLEFRYLGLVEDECIEELLAKADAVESDLFQAYEQRDEEAEEKPRGKGAGKALAKGKPAPAAKRPAPRR